MIQYPVDASEGTAALPYIFSRIQLAALLVEPRIRDSVVAGKHLESVEHDSVDRSVSNRRQEVRKFLSRGHLFEKFAGRGELAGGKPLRAQFLLYPLQHDRNRCPQRGHG